MKALLFTSKGAEAKHMPWLMASNPRRPFKFPPLSWPYPTRRPFSDYFGS